jgi:putative phage-type endonuclease
MTVIPLPVPEGNPPASLSRSRKQIGGSEASIILGLNPWVTRLQLWAEKTGRIFPPDLDEVEAVQWGTRLEPLVADVYAQATGRALRVVAETQVHPAHPWMIGHLDRIVRKPEREDDGVLEVKTTSAYKAGDWREEPPLMYQVQLQHYLAVTGLRWGSFAVLIGGQNLRWADIERNDQFIELLIAQEREFLDAVESDTPPEPGSSAKEAKVLEALYPSETPESAIALPPESLEWDVKLHEAKKEIKDWETVKREMENHLKAAIGERQFGVLPAAAGRYSWRTINKKSYTVEETSYRELRRLKT